MTAALAANPTQRYRWVILLIATFARACACFFVRASARSPCSSRTTCNSRRYRSACWCRRRSWVPIVGLLVAGELLDRYSERLVVGLGTLIVALALCASLWATDYLTILLFLVVVGAGYSTAQPGGSKSSVTLVRQDPAGLRHGHPPGRAAAGRRAVRRAAAVPGGDLRLAQRISSPAAWWRSSARWPSCSSTAPRRTPPRPARARRTRPGRGGEVAAGDDHRSSDEEHPSVPGWR